MVPAGFHLDGWNGPACGIPVDLLPLHAVDHAGAGDGQGVEPKGIPDDVAKFGLVVWLIDQPEKPDHVLCFGDAGPRCRDVDGELLPAVAERIVAVAFEVG